MQAEGLGVEDALGFGVDGFVQEEHGRSGASWIRGRERSLLRGNRAEWRRSSCDRPALKHTAELDADVAPVSAVGVDVVPDLSRKIQKRKRRRLHARLEVGDHSLGNAPEDDMRNVTDPAQVPECLGKLIAEVASDGAAPALMDMVVDRSVGQVEREGFQVVTFLKDITELHDEVCIVRKKPGSVDVLGISLEGNVPR